jgi:hypothetical protein
MPKPTVGLLIALARLIELETGRKPEALLVGHLVMHDVWRELLPTIQESQPGARIDVTDTVHLGGTAIRWGSHLELNTVQFKIR